MQDILQDLGVDGFIFWSDLFDVDKLGTLLREGDGLATYPKGVLALLQCGVVQLRTEDELLMQHACLLLSWIEAVLIGFLHRDLFFLEKGKGEVGELPLLLIRNA
jgi:hypothetical protein